MGVWTQLLPEPIPVVVVPIAQVVGDDGVEAVELAPGMHVAPSHVYAVIPGIGQDRGQGVGFVPFCAGVPNQATGVARLAAVQTAPRPCR